MKKKILCLVLCIAVLATSVTSLSACGSKEDPNTFSVLLAGGIDPAYYSDFSQNPVMLYLMKDEYAGTKLNFDFKSLVSGSERDQFNTMVSTGEIYNLIDMSHSSFNAEALYEMDLIMDLTDYVNKYMPNYLALLEQHPELETVAYSTIDGEKKILQLLSAFDIPDYAWEGHLYRRDWIIKYGKNPSTGASFTGGYSIPFGQTGHEGSWTDDVIFPSWYSDNEYVQSYKEAYPDWDGSYPIFISDWEWMFEIFETALKEENAGNDSYCFSIYYTGYMETGDFFSAFGGGAPLWYRNKETGKADFGGTSESMKSYISCLNTWWNNGWMDEEFDQRSTDMFYAINTAAVYSGKVGMWAGRTSQIGCQLEDNANSLTKGLYAAAAPQPINDVYGAEETKGKIPYSLFQNETLYGRMTISSATAEKNTEALFTFLNTMYDPANAVMIECGLTKEQFEEIKPLQELMDGKTVQERFGLENGSYYSETVNGKTLYYLAQSMKEDNQLLTAISLNRFPAKIRKTADIITKDDYVMAEIKRWDLYTNYGYARDMINGQMSNEQNLLYSKVRNNINTKMSVEIPKFIKGENDMDKDWTVFFNTIRKMTPEKATAVYEEIYNG